MSKNTNHYTYIFFAAFFSLFILSSCKEQKKNLTPEKEKMISAKTQPQDIFDPDEIYRWRMDKDDYFNGDNSPVPGKFKNEFRGLSYYTPTDRFVFKVALEKNPKPDTVEILTTKSSDVRKMLRYGFFKFRIGGRNFRLTAFYGLPEGRYPSLFVPFTDSTCGNGSYGGGRYLDIEMKRDGEKYILDFNYAYNPYCAYNSRYSCPLVPSENYLDVSIDAGEKEPTFGDHH